MIQTSSTDDTVHILSGNSLELFGGAGGLALAIAKLEQKKVLTELYTFEHDF